jgi:hypothetical protein
MHHLFVLVLFTVHFNRRRNALRWARTALLNLESRYVLVAA